MITGRAELDEVEVELALEEKLVRLEVLDGLVVAELLLEVVPLVVVSLSILGKAAIEPLSKKAKTKNLMGD